jgi:hypothetical protein
MVWYTSFLPLYDAYHSTDHTIIVAILKKKVYEKETETDLLYQQIAIYRDGLIHAPPSSSSFNGHTQQSAETKRHLLAKRRELEQIQLQLKQVRDRPINHA